MFLPVEGKADMARHPLPDPVVRWWERLLVVGLLLRLEATTPSGMLPGKYNRKAGRCFQPRGFAPSAPGRGRRENWEVALEEYGKKK